MTELFAVSQDKGLIMIVQPGPPNILRHWMSERVLPNVSQRAIKLAVLHFSSSPGAQPLKMHRASTLCISSQIFESFSKLAADYLVIECCECTGDDVVHPVRNTLKAHSLSWLFLHLGL